MKEQKKSSTYQLLKLPVAIALALSGSLSYAVGLGPIQVHSHQGENLNASITITGLTSAQAKNVKVNLANNSEYAKRGVKKTPEQSKLNFRLVPTKSGYRIAVSSSGKIDENFLNFVVTVSGAEEQNIVREYSAFLEKSPNVLLNNAIVEKSPAPTKAEKGKKNKKEKVRNEPKVEPTFDGKSRVWLDGQEVPLDNNVVASSETVEAKPVKEEKTKAGAKDFSTRTDRNGQIVYMVKRGDSLTRIANRFRPKSVPLDVAKQAIFNTNRHAFSGSTETSLMAGYKLTIPKDLVAAANPEPQQPEEKPAETITASVQEPVNNENLAPTPTAEKPETEKTAEVKEPEKPAETEKPAEPVVAENKTPALVLDSVDSVGQEEKPAEPEKPAEVVKTETPAEAEKPAEVKEPEKPAEPVVKNIEIEPIANKDDSLSSKFASSGGEFMSKIENLINQYLPEDLAKKEIATLPMWQVVLIGGFLALLILLLLLKALFSKKKDADEDEGLDLSQAAQDFEKEQERLKKVETLKAKIKPEPKTTLDKEEAKDAVVDGFSNADLVEADGKIPEITDSEIKEEGAKTQGFEEVSIKEDSFLEVNEDEDKAELSDLDLEIADLQEEEENLGGGLLAAGAELVSKDEEVVDFTSFAESQVPAGTEEDFFDELTKESSSQADDLPEVEVEELKSEKEVEISADFDAIDISIPAQEKEVNLDDLDNLGSTPDKTKEEVVEKAEETFKEVEVQVDEVATSIEKAPSPVPEVEEKVEEKVSVETAEISEIPQLSEEVKTETETKGAKLSPDFSIDLPTPKTPNAEERVSVEEVMAKIEQASAKVAPESSQTSALNDFPAGSDEALTLGADDLSNSASDFVANNTQDADLFNKSDEPFNSANFSIPESSKVDERDNLPNQEPITHELPEADFDDIKLDSNDLVANEGLEDNFADIPAAPVSSSTNDAPFNEADIGAMNINLDLATAYIDAGIKLDKAKIWLDEVLQKGADIQKQKARDLMEKLNKKL